MAEIDADFLTRAAGVQGVVVPPERVGELARRADLANATTRALAAELAMEAEPATFVALLEQLRDTE